MTKEANRHDPAVWRGGDKKRVLWQSAPVIALENAVYDSPTTVQEVRRHGNQGVGTWEQLNGEGLVIDGIFYQVLSDGSVHEQPGDARMPWAAVTFFDPDVTWDLPTQLNYDELGQFLDPQLPTLNNYYALRIEGTFQAVTTRSLPEQHEPYPPLAVVERTQPEFSFSDIEGTMVGFRSPPFVTNVSPTGYHLHFLDSERTGGGHVLSFTVDAARISVERLDSLRQFFPDYPEYNRANLAEADS